MFDYSSKPFADPANDPICPTEQKILAQADFKWQRVEMVREERNMTKAAFAKSIGLSPGGYQNMINGDYISGSVALSIEYKHGFNSEWLLTGEGEARTDQWEKIRKEIEDSIIRDLNIYFGQKLLRTRPMVLNKDKNERQYRK